VIVGRPYPQRYLFGETFRQQDSKVSSDEILPFEEQNRDIIDRRALNATTDRPLARSPPKRLRMHLECCILFPELGPMRAFTSVHCFQLFPKRTCLLINRMLSSAQTVRLEQTAPFWEAPVGKALPAYREAFLPRTASAKRAEPTRTEAAPVRVELARHGAGDSLLFLHEASSVRGALEEMVQRNAAFVLVVGDPFHRSSPKANIPATTPDIVRVSRETHSSEAVVDTESHAVIGLFTERDFLRCLSSALVENQLTEHAALSLRLRDTTSPLYDRFGTLKVASNTVFDAVLAMRERDVQSIPVIGEEEHEEDYILPGRGRSSPERGPEDSFTLALPPRSFRGILTARDLARLFLAQDPKVQDAVCSFEWSGASSSHSAAESHPILLRHLLSWRLRRLYEGAQPLRKVSFDEDTVLYESEHHAVVSVPKSASVRDAIAAMARQNVSTLLVSESSSGGSDAGGPYPSIFGVITLRDLMRHVFYPGRNPLALSVETLIRERWAASGVTGPKLSMEERKYGISADDEVAHALRLLGGMNERHIPVYVYNDADQTSNCIAMVSVKEMLSGVHAAEQRRRQQRYRRADRTSSTASGSF
jgi:CBS domain-containing protein